MCHDHTSNVGAALTSSIASKDIAALIQSTFLTLNLALSSERNHFSFFLITGNTFFFLLIFILIKK
jgi:hypothetical protein